MQDAAAQLVLQDGNLIQLIVLQLFVQRSGGQYRPAARLRRVCSAWRAAMSDPTLWRQMLRLRFGTVLAGETSHVDPETLFRRLSQRPSRRPCTTYQDVLLLLELSGKPCTNNGFGESADTVLFSHTFPMHELLTGTEHDVGMGDRPCEYFRLPVPELAQPMLNELRRRPSNLLPKNGFMFHATLIRKSDGKTCELFFHDFDFEKAPSYSEDLTAICNMTALGERMVSEHVGLQPWLQPQPQPCSQSVLSMSLCVPNEGPAEALFWFSFMRLTWDERGEQACSIDLEDTVHSGTSERWLDLLDWKA